MNKDVPCRGPSVHSKRPIPGKGVARGAGDGIPSYNGSASVSECEGTAGHSASHCFSDHLSTVARQRRLGQGQEGAGLSKGYSAHAPHPVGRFVNTLTVVGGCSVRCTG